MGRQSFTLKYTAIGGDVLLEIPRNHLEREDNKLDSDDVSFGLLSVDSDLSITSFLPNFEGSHRLWLWIEYFGQVFPGSTFKIFNTVQSNGFGCSADRKSEQR